MAGCASLTMLAFLAWCLSACVCARVGCQSGPSSPGISPPHDGIRDIPGIQNYSPAAEVWHRLFQLLFLVLKETGNFVQLTWLQLISSLRIARLTFSVFSSWFELHIQNKKRLSAESLEEPASLCISSQSFPSFVLFACSSSVLIFLLPRGGERNKAKGRKWSWTRKRNSPGR